MTEQLRTAAQAAEDFLDRRWRKTGACDDDIREHAEALRAALAEPQPVHECADNDSPWLVCKPCAAEGKCKQAEPQPEPGAQSRTIREIICYIRENDLGSIGDEWIAALQVPQAQQPRFVKPWQERLPRSPMNCSASEVVAAQQAEIDEWRNGHALQPLKERPDFIAGYTAGLADGKACAERDALEQPKSEPAAQNDWMWEDCSTALESMTCPWCDRQGTDICQHADDAKNCEKTK
jgi:hypothetical protein